MGLLLKKTCFFVVSGVVGLVWMHCWHTIFIPVIIAKHQDYSSRRGAGGPFRFSAPAAEDPDAFLPAEFAPAESELLNEYKRDVERRERTPAPTRAPPPPPPRVVSAAVRRTAVESAWRAPGDLRGGCAHQALVANRDALGAPCDSVSRRYANAKGREDLALASRYFCRKRNGTFVEVGAVDGLKDSVSLLFEKALGWRGVSPPASGLVFLPTSLHAAGPRRGPARVGRAAPREALVAGEPRDRRGRLPRRGHDAVLGRGLPPPRRPPGVRAPASGLKKRPARRDPGSPRARYASRDEIARGGGKWDNVVPCRPFGDMLREAGFSRSRGVDLVVVDAAGGEHVVLETMDWDITVRVFLVANPAPPAFDDAANPDDDASASAAARATRALEQAGYRRAAWDVAAFCDGIPALDVKQKVACGAHTAWEHPTLVLDLDVIKPSSDAAFGHPWACCGCEDLAHAIAGHLH